MMYKIFKKKLIMVKIWLPCTWCLNIQCLFKFVIELWISLKHRNIVFDQCWLPSVIRKFSLVLENQIRIRTLSLQWMTSNLTTIISTNLPSFETFVSAQAWKKLIPPIGINGFVSGMQYRDRSKSLPLCKNHIFLGRNFLEKARHIGTAGVKILKKRLILQKHDIRRKGWLLGIRSSIYW